MKNFYLLILFALLNNFCHCQYKCYVCDGDESSCGDGGERKCQYDDSYTDRNFIYFCKYYPELGGTASETTVFFMLLIKIVCLCRIDLINVLRDFVHIFIPNINFAFQSMTNAN